MTADSPTADLLRDALDRLDRQEQRTQAIEALLTHPGMAPGSGRASAIRSTVPITETPRPTAQITPLIIPRPYRLPAPPPSPAAGGGVASGSPPSGGGEEADPGGPSRAVLTQRIKELEARLAAAEARLAFPETGNEPTAVTAAQLEEERREASRLEILGRLAAGVAHDFNNLLTVITGNAELLRDLLPPADPLRDAADLIVTTGHTAAQVTRQLLTFARPGASATDPVALDPNAAVRGIERVLRRLADRAELDLLLAPGVEPIRVAPGRFDQVLLNLVVNARDAIAGAGVIAVRTAMATVRDDRPGWPADRPAGEYVALTVTDTGCGMTEEVKARAFARGFTTKGPRGSGLGLATVWDIVRGAGGHVEVESSPVWGTAVRVFWPVAEVHPGPTSVTGSRPATGGETVLLVQDGDAVRDVAAVALQQAGYRVLEAADGETGEDRARLFAGPIDLLVTDLGLPKGDGRELAARVRVARPGVKVLFVSGSSPDGATAGAFLAKPYTPTELLDAVRRALDTPT